jgi:soluble lytic murein transglycosylase-like protein
MSIDYRAIARQKAIKYKLLPDVFERQIDTESGFNPKALSPAGARGIAQIMPETAKGWGVNPDDPIAALDAAAKNMAGYINTHGGLTTNDPVKMRAGYEKGLRAYNAGPGAVEASKNYAETNRYVKKIIDPNTFSFTEALKGRSATPQAQPQSQSQPQQIATNSGRTFVIFQDEDEKYIPKILLDNKVKELAPPQTAFNPVTMLINAFAQVPNYLQ